MKSRGRVERIVSFMKHLADAKKMRQRVRLILTLGTAVCVLWISPISAQTTGGAAFEMFTSGTETIAIAGDATRIGETGVVGHAWATTGQNFGVRGVTNSTTGIGVNGRASATTGQNFGVRGITLSAGDPATGFSAFGVFGRATDTTAPSGSGLAIGTGGRSDSPGGIGVFGRVTALTGENYGVVGRTDSAGDAVTGNASFGVFGRNGNTTAPSGSALAMGVGGRSDAPGGIGVWGRAAATSGVNFGVFGVTNSAGDATTGSPAYGVFGFARATSGLSVGVLGRTDSANTSTTRLVFAVQGQATATSGNTVGVGGSCVSTSCSGVTGSAFAPTGVTEGVRGESSSTSGQGVFGLATATSGNTVGVRGNCVSPSCTGVDGHALATSGAGVAVGVSGISDSTSGVGVIGIATATSGSTFGVSGGASSPNGIAIQGGASNGALAGNFTGGPVSMTCPTMPCLVVNGTGVAVPDLAEDMPVARPVSPGDVVVLTRGQGYGVAPATRAYDTLVAGVVSTAPRVRFGIGLKKAAPVAMVGVVKAKATGVNGAIEFGDLLTTSPVAGRLMRCEAALRCVGAIVGKALEPLAKGEQTILVLLWRQ